MRAFCDMLVFMGCGPIVQQGCIHDRQGREDTGENTACNFEWRSGAGRRAGLALFRRSGQNWA
jgi:hypothetical protein